MSGFDTRTWRSRYTLAPSSGMTSQAEFESAERLLLSKKLIEDGGDRRVFLRQREGRRFDEGRYLYLWDEPGDAQAIAEELNAGDFKRRWRVDELSGVDVSEVLDPDRLRRDYNLPDRPRVLKIRPELRIDREGEDYLWVLVLLPDDTTEEERIWAVVKPIHRAIDEALIAAYVPISPLVWFRTESEYEKQIRGWR